ncbi:TAXI family TRAP transporter solute-binding subunit [Geothermobacter hydrogeniphilus]|uniref:C4-dicarboxylate ABC transporter substrate-binding protein n=1 Tax=Geothermobacter hydrogeniphilus TaxID=1969733 RepID=A0A1X0YCW6_9BACT|nr:TAXI family TRAP transporter solute-binding subunit [Geothermobacter hydrogeniphilus]ORJ63035.1 C4-dicarboxylate ABC transporter substrate-binding protein [Geothermobacter hydrogeniphilus]
MTIRRPFTVLAILFLLLLVPPQTGGAATTTLQFSGGPDGGTFQYFSNGIATRLSRLANNLEVNNLSSAGSVENIRRVNAGEADFGIAYAGDIFLAAKERLDKDPQNDLNVRVMAYLYGAPVHLVTLASSDIHQVKDLVGHRIAVGGTGSGAAAAAQRYFTARGLWTRMKIEFIGYSEAARALAGGRIDAMWILAGCPNASVTQLAARKKIRLLDTWETGVEKQLLQNYPFYDPVTIPAATYPELGRDIRTFQDAALWIVGSLVPSEIVHRALEDIFSPEGLSYMVKVKSTARAMSITGALTGVVTPLHPGAEKFWEERGLTQLPSSP